MRFTGLRFFVCALATGAALLAPAPSLQAKAVERSNLVVYDNDFFGPASTDVLPLIANPTVKVLGFTVVTGDGWRDEETAYLLRFLEIAGRPDIPVVKGAVFPLVNSYARTKAWEQAHGRLVWKGAWNDPGPENTFHPTEPFKITPDPAGPPTIVAHAGVAAEFLIQQVHEHPHQVTILAAGPLTNIALAIRLDPDFASLAKQLIFMGAMVDTNLKQVTGSANFETDFNFWFDPEAAHIVLTAPWAKITAVGDISNGVTMSRDLVARIAAKTTPVTTLIARYAQNLPLWDELAASIAADPTLATHDIMAYMDVEIDHGMFYGAARVWTDATRPHLGEQPVHLVTAIDTDRFVHDFVRAAQAAAPSQP